MLVANAFFRGHADLVMLVIDPAKLRSQIRWEPPNAPVRVPDFMQGSVYPHVYGPINVDAVARVEALVPGESGTFTLPRPA